MIEERHEKRCVKVEKCGDDWISQVWGTVKTGSRNNLIRVGSSHGWISGKTAIMLKNKPGSESVVYDLKRESTPSRRKLAYSGSYLRNSSVSSAPRQYQGRQSALEFEADRYHIYNEVNLWGIH